MKKYSGILVLVFLLAYSSLKAQLSEKLMPHFGFMVEIVNLEAVNPNNPSDLWTASYQFYNVHLGAYYTLMHKNDVLSLGIDPSLQVGLRFSGSDISWMGQLPVFLMGRLGAGATVYNQQKLGIGAGIGAVGTYMSIGGLDAQDPVSGNIVSLDFSQFFILPAVILEGTLLTQGGALTGRIHIGLGKAKGEGTVFSGNNIATLPATYANFGLGLIYDF